MKEIVVKTILPSILGIVTVLVLVILYNIIVNYENVFTFPNKRFFTLFIPLTIFIALIIQLFIALPLWKRFKSHKKLCGLTCFNLTALLCITSGVAFGLFFWEPGFGMKDLVLTTILGIFAFSIYWVVNLATLKQLDY